VVSGNGLVCDLPVDRHREIEVGGCIMEFKIVTVDARTGIEAKRVAEEKHPRYYTFTYKSLAGRKQHPLIRGKVTKYEMVMIRRRP